MTNLTPTCCCLLLALFLSPVLPAQKTDQHIRKYYSLVNQAELHITDRAYPEALTCYLKASKIKKLFSYDAHNALLCAVETSRFATAIRYAEILIRKGVPLVFFHQRKFVRLTQSPEWQAFTAKGAGQITANTDLRKKIDDLIVLDQKYRGDNLKYADSLVIVDSVIRLELNQIMAQYGYPSEDLTGLWMHSDSTFFLRNPLDILLLHAMKDNADDLVGPLLHSVEKGDMHPLKFVMLSAYISKPNNYNYSCNGNNQVVYMQVANEIFTCCCELEKQIDANRNKIYLEPVSDLKKKIEYGFRQDRRFKLNISYSTSYLSYAVDMEAKRKQLQKQTDIMLIRTLPNDNAYY